MYFSKVTSSVRDNTLGDLPLREVDNFKYLRLTIASDLSWNKQIANLCSAAYKKLWFLKINLKHSTSATKCIAYKAVVRPTIEDACQVWHPFRKHYILELEKVQRDAKRLICSNYMRTESVYRMLAENNLPALSARLEMARLKLLFLFLKNKLNVSTTQYLKTRFT